MLKMVFIATRKPGMTSEDFKRYWREEHAPKGAGIPGIARYVQQHAVASAGEPDPPFDGIAEMWFEDSSSMETPEFAAVVQDTENFLDPDRSHGFVVEVHEIVSG